MQKSIKIGNTEVGDGCPPFVIAEISANHNGSIDKAKKLIELAKSNGADAVKIQTYTADTMTLDSNREDFQIKGGLWDGYNLYELYKQAYTPWEWQKELFQYAKSLDILIFSTPFDETAVDFLEDLESPCYKVASFEMTDLLLIEKIAKTKKPIIMSTGMSTLEEIKESVAVIEKHHQNYVILHCVSAYPADYRDFNLKTLSSIEANFGCLVGLSDHSLSNMASILSISLGACVIEKHFIESRADKGPDSDFSLEPKDLKSLCEDVKSAWSAMGEKAFERSEGEIGNKQFRRSLYFSKDLKKGDVINSDCVRRVRPGYGLEPKFFNELMGKKVNQDIEFATAVKWELIEK